MRTAECCIDGKTFIEVLPYGICVISIYTNETKNRDPELSKREEIFYCPFCGVRFSNENKYGL